jgi:hypothetical protein
MNRLCGCQLEWDMRIWYLALCLSLISGVFHAFDMPLEILSTPTTVTVNAETHKACHEAQDSSHPKSCHITGHLCCMGFSGLQNQTSHGALLLNHMLNPVFQILLLQKYPSKQFKPPKRHTLI